MSKELISRLIKSSKAVYLAAEERVADDLAALMLQAAVCIAVCIKDIEAERAKVAKLEAQNNRLIAAINYMLDTLDVIQFRDAANMRLHTQHPAYEKLQQAISEES